MDAGWVFWWPSLIVFVLGLLILVALVAVVLRHSARTRRELGTWLGSVRTSTARLRLGDTQPNTARDRFLE